MSRKFALACIMILGIGPAAPAQTPFSRTLVPGRTALSRVGLDRHWMAAVPLTGIERLIEISISGTLFFAQTDHGNFHTFDAETGRLLWSAHFSIRSSDVFPASANSKLVFVTNSNYLYALDRGTGRPVWKENLGTLPSSATACDEQLVMVGLRNGLLRAFHADTKLFAWNWQTNGPMTSRPIPSGRLVAFGSHDGKAYVALSETPKMIYRIATGGEIHAPMGVHGTHTFFIPSADKNLYAVDLFTAGVKWAFSAGAPLMQEPMVAGDDVYVVNAAGILNALDANTGQLRWSVSTLEGRVIALSPTRLYLESADDDLFIVDRGTGRVLAEPRGTYQRAGLDLREYAIGFTNSQNDRIYLATKSGLAICLREIGLVQPRPLRDPKEPPFGFIPNSGIVITPVPTPGVDFAPADGATPPAEGATPPVDGATPPAAEPAPAPEPKEQ